ncbi:MAG: group II intron reverse transcriptase/maturase [Chloroflexi bacterium]|nr:group II intron reverse transcriptase/maturase [Chloroflexota bacterium]
MNAAGGKGPDSTTRLLQERDGDCGDALETPGRLRDLQRALYVRAKNDQHFRAYALYDKVHRRDILAHAYALAQANGGAPGPDGLTFAEIEASGRDVLLDELREELRTKTYRPGPVRRVYIPKLNGGERPLGIPNIRDRVVQTAVKLLLEPLFEADFDPDSYGFRPKRAAHDALDAVRAALEAGLYWVIDADVTAYFDTIPHDRLMKAVAERVVDRAMLALVKRFLEACVVDERDGGRPRRARQGTPQGGVISPLLANVYLHLLDRNFRRRTRRGDLHGRLVRYADDFVLLAPHRPDRALAWLQQLMTRLGLALHPDKTRVLDARRDDFVFLGHTHRWRFHRLYLNVRPKALRRIRDELRRKTRQTGLSLDAMIADLNPYIQGARHYFRRVRRRTLYHLDGFVNQRLARWWARKHGARRPAWSLVSRDALRRHHGLERWNLPAATRPADSRFAP